MGKVECDLELRDGAQWIRIEKININIDYMYGHFDPLTCYFSRIGMTDDEEEDIVFTPKVIPLLTDNVFLSTILADFVEKREYLDSRTEYDQMDYHLSLICIANKYCDCEIFFNISPNLIFEGKNWVGTMEGIAIYFQAHWDTVNKWAWELQELEVQAIINGLKEDECKKLSEEFRLNEISRFEKMLAYDRKVLSNWDKEKDSNFKNIYWDREESNYGSGGDLMSWLNQGG